MAGDIRCVRERGPCRPRKLRFVVEAQRSPGGTMSPLMATHIEHPELRPFEPGIAKDAVETFLFRLPLHCRGARRDQSRHLADPAGQHGRRGAQVFDAGVGAGADEDAVDRDIRQLSAGRDPHIVERVAQIFGPRRIVLARGIGDAAVDRQSVVRRRAPGDDRRNRSGVERNFTIECRLRIRGKAQTRPRPHGRTLRHGARTGGLSDS